MGFGRWILTEVCFGGWGRAELEVMSYYVTVEEGL
jgi:hypothetical protein